MSSSVATASLSMPESNHTGTHHAVSEKLLDLLSLPIPFASRVGEIMSASTTRGTLRLVPQRVSELPCHRPCPCSMLRPECHELYAHRKSARDSSWSSKTLPTAAVSPQYEHLPRLGGPRHAAGPWAFAWDSAKTDPSPRSDDADAKGGPTVASSAQCSPCRSPYKPIRCMRIRERSF
jgi:hypothetical protein